MVFSLKRRFIAGAICPQCKKVDVITVFHENGSDWQVCIACNHKKTFNYQCDIENKQSNSILLKHVDES